MKRQVVDAVRILSLIDKSACQIPKTRSEALRHHLWPEYQKAEVVELESFHDLDVWELVKRPKDANVIGVRWVYDMKFHKD